MDMGRLFLAQSICRTATKPLLVTVLGIKLSSACFLFQVCATFKFIPRDITSSIRLNQEQLCSFLTKSLQHG